MKPQNSNNLAILGLFGARELKILDFTENYLPMGRYFLKKIVRLHTITGSVTKSPASSPNYHRLHHQITRSVTNNKYLPIPVMDPSTLSEQQMQLCFHQAHHLLVIRRRGFLGLERAKILYLAYQMYTHLSKAKPIRKHISILTGAMWVDELINNPNPSSFYENMGMTVPTFMKLKDLLEGHGVLCDSKYVTSTEKLATLLYMLITGLSNRKLQQRFQ
ncbi:hypothetical protein PCANC_22006 [Puccinia coronata f. sp. avenae]|uniref:DUF8040 domain-containing protein n=1 Tax=Puccinia coronata f. sp. avenae TaxID=200324 RepID=A0A2N5SFE1_9BASI|nr:hypothetical protein PCANC_22006 [Puccinia coronata f. sp. avenae]